MSSTDTAERAGKEQKVSVLTLTAMVVGSMIGSGVFLLPRRFGVETGVLGAIIAWTIAGSGMLMLAFVFQRLAYENGGPLRSDAVVAGVATFYALFLIYAAGLDKLLLSCILYAVGAALYVMARRERGLRVFTPAEAVLFGIIVIGAIAGVVALFTGAIAI